MTRKIYALLVGIAYFKNPKISALTGCENDVENVGKYLKSLHVEGELEVEIKELVNTDATRDRIITEMKSQGMKAGSNDIFFFFFSSHGLQEHAEGVFGDSSSDKLLECLITHDAYYHGIPAIADKELRFLIKKIYDNNNCEIVTVFDCCHSGDNTRSVDLEKNLLAKVVTNPDKSRFIGDKRNYADFIFAEEFPLEKVATFDAVEQWLPQGEHTSVTACSSYEPAYMEDGVSLFTEAFLAGVQSGRGDLSYYDLHSRILNRLRGKQTPTLYCNKNVEKPAFRTFLTGTKTSRPIYGNVIYVRELGEWTIDFGAIHGAKTFEENSNVIIVQLAGDETCEARIKEVYSGFSLLEMEPYAAYSKSDPGGYTGNMKSLIAKPVFLQFEGDEAGILVAKKYFEEKKDDLSELNLFTSEKPDSIPLFLHAEQNEFFITLEDKSKVVGAPASGYSEESVAKVLKSCQSVSAWNFTYELQNNSSHSLLDEDAVRISVKQDGKELPVDNNMITLSYNLSPVSGKIKESGRCQISFKNTSQISIHMACLYLGENYAILIKMLNNVISHMEPDAVEHAFEKNNGNVPFNLSMDEFNSNKKETVIILKLIYATSTFQVDLFEQKGIKTSTRSGERKKSGFDFEVLEEEEKISDDWRTQLYKIIIPNPHYKEV